MKAFIFLFIGNAFAAILQMFIVSSVSEYMFMFNTAVSILMFSRMMEIAGEETKYGKR